MNTAPKDVTDDARENADGWLIDGSLLYRLTDERRPQNRDEIRVTMADGSRTDEACGRRARELLDRIRSTKKACRDDGRCQYAIDHGAEGLGHCPAGKCVMPASTDVRSILLDVVPGPDGDGVEVYAKTTDDVVRVMTDLSEKIDGLEGALQSSRAEFNAAIDFAIQQGIGAAVFLDAWRHGDTSEWPEFIANNQGANHAA